jgi:hypothetical protein
LHVRDRCTLRSPRRERARHETIRERETDPLVDWRRALDNMKRAFFADLCSHGESLHYAALGPRCGPSTRSRHRLIEVGASIRG